MILAADCITDIVYVLRYNGITNNIEESKVYNKDAILLISSHSVGMYLLKWYNTNTLLFNILNTDCSFKYD